MAISSRMRKIWIAAPLIALILLWNPLSRLVYAIRIASTFQQMASGKEGQYPDVRATKISRRVGGREYVALVYRSTKAVPTKALIFEPGISELGCYHPKLIALARFFAEQGLLVITPDVEEFRHLQISAEPIDQFLLWHHEAETMDGAQKARKVGLAGVSYSGALALIAAAEPAIREKTAFVVSIGSYHNLIRCTELWFSNEPDDRSAENNSTKLYARSKFYARWVIMLAALDMLPVEQDRIFLKNTLTNLLLQKDIPQPQQELTSEGARWYNMAIARNIMDPELSQAIQKHLAGRLYRRLDPEPALRNLHCPVFLIHGAYDDLIPSTESLELHQRLPNSELLISPFLTHTQPSNAKLSWKQKAAAGINALIFCYRFSKVMR
jgi:pimeloyl-ACP methyl ester carboxylesterase